MKFEKIVLYIFWLSYMLLLSCESIKYQYWDNGKVKAKQVKNNVTTTKYYYDENGKIIVNKTINKNGTYIKNHYDDSGKVDTKEILDTDGTRTEYKYDHDGTVVLERVSNDVGLILWRTYYNGKVLSEESHFNGKRHGLCSRFYCQDGSLKYQCVFKNGEPYNGIWQFEHYWEDLFFKYTDGKKEKIDLKLKEFPYFIGRYYSVTSPKDSCFKLKLTINTSSTTCEGHGDGELTLKSAEITGYDSTCITLSGQLAFKIISRKNSWILLKGKTDDDSLFLDSITITNGPDGMWLSSRYKAIPGIGSSYNFRTLSAPDTL